MEKALMYRQIEDAGTFYADRLHFVAGADGKIIHSGSAGGLEGAKFIAACQGFDVERLEIHDFFRPEADCGRGEITVPADEADYVGLKKVQDVN